MIKYKQWFRYLEKILSFAHFQIKYLTFGLNIEYNMELYYDAVMIRDEMIGFVLVMHSVGSGCQF